jgi:xanthine dehydrogenase accessory factor
MALTVVVRGVGDVGSAVAHRLFVEGYAVVIQDGPTPSTTRRGMAFADAVFDGTAILESVHAMRADDLARAAGRARRARYGGERYP